MAHSNNRPMSPHLQIYRWRVTMLASTLHRATGPLISLGLFLLVCKLAAFAILGAEGFIPSGIFANAFWFIWSLAVYYHLCNGIRHLVWDVGHGFEIETAEKSAKIVMASALALTIITWAFA